MRVIPFACVLLASARIAIAQPPPASPPIAQSPTPTPVGPADPPVEPTPPPVAPAPPPEPSPPTTPPVIPAPPPPKLTTAEKRAAERAARAKAEAACTSRSPDCNWLATLSSLERLSMRRAIEARGFVVEPSPWGKVIGKIHIYNEDVFAEKNRLLQFLNHFHYTTRERTIRMDLVAEEGQPYTQEIVEETARHLRDPLFSSVIAIIPVTSRDDGKVDLLVVTRDIWSLRLNTQYTFQQGTLTNLATSLSENNFLGSRTVLAAALTMDQGAILAGPLFIDKNLVGQHLELRARVNTIVNRDAFFDGDWETEGSSSEIRLSKSLWRLSSEWGGSVTFSHRYAIERSFLGLDLRPVYCPDDAGALRCQFVSRAQAETLPPEDLLDLTYRQRKWSVAAAATRQWGKAIKHQVSFGHVVDVVRPTLLEGSPGSAFQQQLFVDTVLPKSEIDSAPYVAYGFFQPRYKTRRNVQTYDLAEDLRLGVDAEVSFGVGLRLLGSNDNFQRGGIGGGYTLPWGKDGSARAAASYSFRIQDGEVRDNGFSLNTRFVSPSSMLDGYARLVAEFSFATRWNERVPRFFSIGSDNGLRGFDINEFFGKRVASTQIELRSSPVPLWVLRAGGVLFYDAGGAADTLRNLTIHQDVGIGLRTLLPQTSRELFRFDLAFPLDGAARFSPRFIAGFQSEF
ncbi:MAG: BamA/TamA family outer membrane protein [Kofleriaceae bacterium]